MTKTLEEVKDFNELFEYYKNEGFLVQRVMTSEERKKHDAKAHVFQEYASDIEFRYVPLYGKHVFMFKTKEDRAVLDKYCGVL